MMGGHGSTLMAPDWVDGGEHRRYHRVELNQPIRLCHKNGGFEEFLGDLSMGGCRVFSSIPYAVGDVVCAELCQEGRETLRLSAFVIRRNTTDGTLVEGAKLEFLACSDCAATGYWTGEDCTTLVLADTGYRKLIRQTVDRHAPTCSHCGGPISSILGGQLQELGLFFAGISIEQAKAISALMRSELAVTKSCVKNEKLRRGTCLSGFNIHEIVQCYIEDSSSIHDVYVYNLSAEGISIHHNEVFELGQKIKLVMGLKSISQTFRIESVITQREGLSGGRAYKYGLEFSEQAPILSDTIHSFLAQVIRLDYDRFIQNHRLGMVHRLLDLGLFAWSLILGMIGLGTVLILDYLF
ncbi:MAG: PilZ domain-containing protein [Myxococcota bacterium]|nr:PilZ domain-containing protein [Myxococcota bacterium]